MNDRPSGGRSQRASASFGTDSNIFNLDPLIDKMNKKYSVLQILKYVPRVLKSDNLTVMKYHKQLHDTQVDARLGHSG